MDARDAERPKFTITEAQVIAGNLFELPSSIKEIQELPSERDQNFRISLESGQEYVLKVAAASEEIETLEMQNKAMQHLSENIVGQSSPEVYQSRSGAEIEEVEGADGTSHYIRLLSFLPGRLLSQVNPQSSDLLEDYGRFIGSISKGLTGFNHPSAHREFYWDLKRANTVIANYSRHITDPEKRELVSYFLSLYEDIVLPLVDHLRESVIHNDANDNNVVVVHSHQNDKRRFGILDFGDMVHSSTINELAIAIAYAILDKADPISVAQSITAGYHAVFPISELELEILFPLICARLATSVSVSAYQKTLEPDNEYLTISETPAWNILTLLRLVPQRYFTYCLRSSVGLEPCPASAEVREWLRDNASEFASPIGKKLDQTNSI
ncbi:MAG: phosphotransferase, partial [Candidatus Thorarchaeota archaeon]